MPPLHYCVARDLITGPAVISALRDQADVEWRGHTPVFWAKSARVVELFLEQVQNNEELLGAVGRPRGARPRKKVLP